ncbi:protein cornichon-like protein 1-like isoform X2 [Iris pallida]|uniref:Protein cornichon-like protein 1-like isoform X2 n=1 Tax=Iris pallida TaxID=29817 RepID=A0AAX6GKR1_IRIPA|nr:protein cornichon-like protein 1-like isoform X2 [Iris pallida]KAJ6829244.1 protein cornichon-like protein 1-like isoform X2 [Iris pallida]
MKKQHLMDVTEIFRVLNGEKKYRIIKLALYISIFLVVFYRLVKVAVLLMMDEEGLDFRDGLL